MEPYEDDELGKITPDIIAYWEIMWEKISAQANERQPDTGIVKTIRLANPLDLHRLLKMLGA